MVPSEGLTPGPQTMTNRVSDLCWALVLYQTASTSSYCSFMFNNINVCKIHFSIQKVALNLNHTTTLNKNTPSPLKIFNTSVSHNLKGTTLPLKRNNTSAPPGKLQVLMAVSLVFESLYDGCVDVLPLTIVTIRGPGPSHYILHC